MTPLERLQRPNTPKPTYFLHVHPDGGAEVIYLSEPSSLRTLAIVRIGKIEETRTWNFGDLKRDGMTQSVPPRGKGWKLHDDTDDRFTVWRRKAGGA